MKLILIVFLLFPILCFTIQPDSLVVGLALSGGGAKGIAHIGVLKVLEEVGLKPDMISGTSMGSIIGGLYAIGYSADDLEQIVLSQDWNSLLRDEISLQNISIEEKDDFERYAGEFPISGNKISLPKGLVAGQNVSELISKLTLSTHHFSDFSELPIPFLCVATDIETGEAVVLDHGYLPEAIRASMSIPSAFTPIEMDGKLLVDGGLARNLPVQDLLNRGADFVISVDVGSPLRKREELNSLVDVMEQSIAFSSAEENKQARERSDILILPDVSEYSLLDFAQSDSLIIRGERAARVKFAELKKISIKNTISSAASTPLLQIDSLYITKIKIDGLDKVSKNLIIGKLRLEESKWTTIDRIEETIKRIYGSLYFERVTYQLIPTSEGVELQIEVKEKTTDKFKFGLHYDSEFKSALLLNVTYRNFLVMGSKFKIDTRLGEYPRYNASYFIHTGWKPGFGFGTNIFYEKFGINVYDDESDITVASYDYYRYRCDFILQTIFSNDFTVGVNAGYEKSHLKSTIIPADYYLQKVDFEFYHFDQFILLNTLDKKYFSTQGTKCYASHSFMFTVDAGDYVDFFSGGNPDKRFQRFYLSFFRASPIFSFATLHTNYWLGSVKADVITPDNYYYFGGMKSYQKGFIPCMGISRMSGEGKNVHVIKFSLLLELLKNHYFSLHFNAGKGTEKFYDLFLSEDMKEGCGISYGTKTPIGPVELFLMSNKNFEDFSSFFSIGFDFY